MGGLLTSQLITIYLTPVVFLYMDRAASWITAHVKRRHHDEPGELPFAEPSPSVTR